MKKQTQFPWLGFLILAALFLGSAQLAGYALEALQYLVDALAQLAGNAQEVASGRTDRLEGFRE